MSSTRADRQYEFLWSNPPCPLNDDAQLGCVNALPIR